MISTYKYCKIQSIMSMSPIYLMIFLSLATAEVFPPTTRTCSQSETCESRNTCEWVRDKYRQAKIATNSRISESIIDQLKAAVCNKEKQAFCCPSNDADVTFPSTSRSCGKDETCESKETCEWVRDKFKQVRTAVNHHTQEAIIKQLKVAVCNKDKKAFCCPRPTDKFTKVSLRSDDDSDGTYLPSAGNCGGQGDAANIVGGENTLPGEFPFMALLGYRSRCKKEMCPNCRSKIVRCIKYLCGGTLINRRYVLTAAHCHKSTENRPIRHVVLGEWDLNIDPDCQRGHSSLIEHLEGKCLTEPLPRIQKFKIQSSDVTIHPDFRKVSSNNYLINDIALIRLPKLADLNKGTGLTCLPLGDAASSNLGIPNLTTGLLSTSPTVVGWGYTIFNPFGDDFQDGFGKGKGNVASPKQKKLSHGLLRNTECQRYEPLDSQICGAGTRGQGACKGDSGSGLYLNGSLAGPPWYQIGIVSYGYLYCDKGEPVVYTRLSSFLPWIKQTLKP